MKKYLGLCIFAWLFQGCADPAGPHKAVTSATPVTSAANGADITYQNVQPIFQTRCTPCHNWNVDYNAVAAVASQGRDSKVFKFVVERTPIEMPLKGSQQSQEITQEERNIIARWVLAGAKGDAISSAPAPVSQGEEVANRVACRTCHVARSPMGAPTLDGQPASYLANQLRAFQGDLRKSEVMSPIAKTLQADEIEALAKYFEASTVK